MSDRVVPHALDVEKALLGAILQRPGALHEAAAVLSPEHFFRDAHRLVFDNALRVGLDGKPFDALVVKDSLLRAGDLDAVGGAAYLFGLTDGVPSTLNAEAYATIVREKARLREVIELSNAIADEAYGQDASA